jgi:DNA polymerase
MIEPWSPEWKASQLEHLASEWSGCEQCPELVQCRENVVMGYGNPDADIMFIGEAPGTDEDAAGMPFVGESGQLLSSMFQGLGVSREDFFITNTVACMPPPGPDSPYRDPFKEEKQNCFDRLRLEIYLVNPMMLVLCGKIAMKALLGGRALSVEKEHGVYRKVVIPGQKIDVEYDAVTVWHPAYVLRMDTPNKDGVYPPGGPADRVYQALKQTINIVSATRREYEYFAERIQNASSQKEQASSPGPGEDRRASGGGVRRAGPRARAGGRSFRRRPS